VVKVFNEILTQTNTYRQSQYRQLIVSVTHWYFVKYLKFAKYVDNGS